MKNYEVDGKLLIFIPCFLLGIQTDKKRGIDEGGFLVIKITNTTNDRKPGGDKVGKKMITIDLEHLNCKNK